MNKFSALAAAAVIALSSGAASATTYVLGPVATGVPLSFGGFVPAAGPFNDIFTFTLPPNGGSGYSAADFTFVPGFSTVLNTMALISNPDGILFNADDTTVATSIAPGGASITMTWGPSDANFAVNNGAAGGSMYLNITGLAVGNAGGIYTGAISASPVPVPEPETYAMMLAGLCAVGFMAARRKSQG